MSDTVIEGYNKAILKDLGSGGNDLTAEVNFPGQKDVVKLTLGGKSAVVAIKDLYTLVWSIGSAEQRDNLMPIKQTLVRKIRKRHIVEVTKDIRKGEKLNVRCETNVPVEIWEGLRGMMGKKSYSMDSVPIIGK